METLEALKAELKAAVDELDALEKAALTAANAARDAAYEGVQEAVDSAKHEYDEKIVSLDKTFGVVDGKYPKDMTRRSAREYEAQVEKLLEDFIHKKRRIEGEPHSKWADIANDFAGLDEANAKVELLQNEVLSRWSREKDPHMLELAKIDAAYSMFEGLMPKEEPYMYC